MKQSAYQAFIGAGAVVGLLAAGVLAVSLGGWLRSLGLKLVARLDAHHGGRPHTDWRNRQ